MTSYYKQIRKFIGHKLLVLPAVAARIKVKNKILLVKKWRSKIWGLPAGAVEPNETAEEAVIREIQEELNTEIRISRLRGIYTSPSFDYSYSNGDKVHPFIVFFDCKLVKNLNFKPNKEIEKIGFFSPDKLPPMLKCCEMKAKDAFARSDKIFLR